MDTQKQAKSDIYHERQIKEMCALHALNNLFQDKKAFSKKDLDDVCIRLSPDNFINPHRSVLGFGNYDVNVIMAAVQKMKCETVWFDKRKDIKCLIPENIFGFILNTPTDYKWGVLRLPFKRKHWIAIRKIGDLYYNLDSKLESPELIGEEKSLFGYLRRELEDGDKELLLVVSEDIEKAGSWKRIIQDEKRKEHSAQKQTGSKSGLKKSQSSDSKSASQDSQNKSSCKSSKSPTHQGSVKGEQHEGMESHTHSKRPRSRRQDESS